MKAKVGDWVIIKRTGYRGMVTGVYGQQYKITFYTADNFSSTNVIQNYHWDDEIETDHAWNLLYGK